MGDVLQQACTLIASFEGFKAKPYQNPGDRPTIGYGSTFYEDYKPVTLNDPAIDWARGTEILSFFVEKSLEMVNALVTIQLTDNQTTALVSFEYNTGHLKGSTLLDKLNTGDIEGAADEFPRWVHAGGGVSQGLVNRRNKERELFMTSDV